MKSFTTAVALVAVLPAVLGQNLMVNSPPNIVQCEPTQLSWTGGSPPYYLSLIPAGQPSAAAIKSFPTQQGNSYTWNVDLQQGTSFSIELKDSTGNTAYSAIETVNPSSDSSCLNSSVSETGSGASSTGASSGAQTASSASTTSAASTGASSGSNSASNSNSVKATGSNSAQSAASSSSSKSSNGATRGSTVGTFSIAGLMGLVGAALF
ncbi:hypothetical protein CERSUDRAFT_117626 [Gelatoporia subvermispora B]|uniref:Secreted protein n=1 Tax=Ceriporiopsis subvermispora (strain B) TaxID=914234 RepID=M2QAX3_CERS8|nr:hypothetical protein CERSUDRAFT_117626 [Gelatoporia subvermispora B]